MILVFFIILIVLMFIIMFLKIEIDISGLNISNEDKSNKNILIKISFKILELKLINIKLNKEKLITIYLKNKLKKGKIKDNNKFKKILKNIINKKIKNEIKKMDIRLEYLDLMIFIGLDDCILTSFLITFISIIISNVLPSIIDKKKDENNYKYRILPEYNKSYYKISLNCIINAKLVHIIYIIFLIKRGRSDKNERTSNRKSYDYSYE